MTAPALRRQDTTFPETEDLPPATRSGSGVRRLPEAVLTDLTHLAELQPAAEPPPVPADARRVRIVQIERVDFDAVCALYGPRAPSLVADDYFPAVPGIPVMTRLPRDDDESPRALDGARVAVLGAAAVLGGLVALL